MPEAALRVAAVVLGTVLLAGCGGAEPTGTTSGFVEHNPDGLHGAVLAEQYVVPDVTLTATDGSAYSMTADTDASLTLVFFGYTQCPDICSIVMADIASALARLDPRDRERVDMLFVTTDPARDDSAALRAYLDRFDPRFEGLTGDLRTIVDLGSALGVEIGKGTRMPSGGYEVPHGSQIIAIDARDRSPVVWTEGTSAEHLAEDLTELLSRPEGGTAS